MNTKSPSVKKRPSGILNVTVSFIFKCFLISTLSVFVLAICFGLEIIFFNKNEVLNQAQAILSMNLNFIALNETSLTHSLIQALGSVYQWVIHYTDSFNPHNGSFIANTISFIALIAGINLSRLLVSLLALPLFLLVFFVCLTDGLVKRDIRKFQGARESTFKFHRAKNYLSIIFFILFFGFMSTPWAISPLWFLVPEAVFLGIFTTFISTHFKKYI